MKKLLGLMLILAVGAVQADEKEWLDTPVISLYDLKEEVDLSAMGVVIVECPEGARLPFKLSIQGQFLELEQEGHLHLKVIKTCYVLCKGEDDFLFSTDKHTWKGFSEFFTGDMQLDVAAEQGEPVAKLKLELNQRI